MARLSGAYTALYERLSRDDEQQGESNSILNQKIFLEDYFHRHLEGDYKHFTDDGYSGVTFERPGFNEMLAEIRAGRIHTVVVKDLSRLGRNYLQVGYFTEVVFPDNDIRFIAINNSVDSASGSENELTPFINIMNEWYAKDTSKKVKAILKSKMRAGIRICGLTPFGYLPDPADVKKLRVDPQAAMVVRHIFTLASRGISLLGICRQLEDEKVLNPSSYMEKFHPENSHHQKVKNPYQWSEASVRMMLSREEYLGHTILGRTEIENFKTKRKRVVPKEEQYRFQNTHEAIIDGDLWETAQRMILRKRRYDPNPGHRSSHVLTGLCFCADCGARMTYRSCEGAHRKGGRSYESDRSFTCGTYHHRYRECSMHYIRANVLEAHLLDLLQRLEAVIRRNENDFCRMLRSISSINREQELRDNRKEINRMEKRMHELDGLMHRLYEDNAGGKMSDRLYEKLMKDYEEEEFDLDKRLHVLKIRTEEMREDRRAPEKIAKAIKKQRSFNSLSDIVVSELIAKIIVYEATGGRGHERRQRIDIWFNHIGPVDVAQLEAAVISGELPQRELTAQEAKEQALVKTLRDLS
ncbi:MAG: recombinase family protein [Lachnospiraceae bacterium]|nr:recombinase family protein [Lachnospiraceae bacterium]